MLNCHEQHYETREHWEFWYWMFLSLSLLIENRMKSVMESAECKVEVEKNPPWSSDQEKGHSIRWLSHFILVIQPISSAVHVTKSWKPLFCSSFLFAFTLQRSSGSSHDSKHCSMRQNWRWLWRPQLKMVKERLQMGMSRPHLQSYVGGIMLHMFLHL